LPLTLLAWRPMVRNSLRGFATVRIGKALVVHDVTVLASNGKIWASLPSKPMVDRNGMAMRDAAGKLRYSPMLEWGDREAQTRFSAAVIAAVRAAHGPEALEPAA
jgi:hypothetical protein